MLVFGCTPAFEMLAVRSRPLGFEIEFTEPLREDQMIRPVDILVEQWRYEGTAGYGGPKLDLKQLKIRKVVISQDRRRLDLQIEGLKEKHVVYFMLPEALRGKSGQPLWSSEAWYTLNNIADQ